MEYAAVCVAISIGAHALIKDFQRAAFVAAVTGVLGTFLADTLLAGYVSPFWPMNLSFGLFVATGVAVAVGLPFRALRKRRSLPPAT